MNKQEFKEAYTPSNMWRYAADEDKCHIGNGPTISQACKEYGADSVHYVFCNLLQDFVRYNHCQQVINMHQLNEIAAVICTEFRNLKCAELVLFFAKAKAGRFGKFFNTIYPMDITTQLCEWEKVCNQRKGELFYAASLKDIEDAREVMYRDAASATRVSSWISKHGQSHIKFD